MSSHTAETRLGLIGKLLLDGEMICETGLHIGAGKGSLDLGGADNPVVKDAFGRPYVPGSSLRGKLRSLLEQSAGLVAASDLIYLSRRRGQEVRIHQSDEPGDEIGLLFGRNPGRVERVTGEAVETTTATPARLTVYDPCSKSTASPNRCARIRAVDLLHGRPLPLVFEGTRNYPPYLSLKNLAKPAFDERQSN